MEPLQVEPFRIEVPDEVLSDLRERLRRTRWPPDAPGRPWEQGTDLGFLQRLVRFWADGFDWRARERQVNSLHHFRAQIDGVPIHFVHARAAHGGGVPLIVTHGWPSAFVEILPLVPLLTDPRAHGIEGPAFDLVVPSLPGYGFSGRPDVASYRTVAAMWHRLMRALGYERYGAAGADFGAGVTTFMALADPAPLIGIHLSTPEVAPWIAESAPLSAAEKVWVEAQDRWDAVERGYSSIQSTRPQTLGYALTDSPAGLAAWILEKWRSWADTGGDVERRFGRDFLLTLLTIYWVTGSITTSMRDYFDNRWHKDAIGPRDRVHVPTGIANFVDHFVPEGDPPREWFERLYDVRRFTPMPRGGHFAAVEEPDLLARDLAAFFAAL